MPANIEFGPGGGCELLGNCSMGTAEGEAMSSSVHAFGVEADRQRKIGTQDWFAIRIRSRHEKKATADLVSHGIEAFLPLSSELHRWSDRKKTVECPLFPGYLFVRIENTPPERLSVLRTHGVVGFVGVHNHGTPIPESQIESIRSLLVNKVDVKEHAYLQEGQRIRIRGGALDGVEGILTACRGEGRLVISIDMIQRSISLSLEGYSVDVIRTGSQKN